MKYDENTGKEIAESRSEEVQLTLKRLEENSKKMGGLNDKKIDICNLLADIDISLGLLVDICGSAYNKFVKAEKPTEAVDDAKTEDKVQ